jgi:hypothetical protein
MLEGILLSVGLSIALAFVNSAAIFFYIFLMYILRDFS